MKAPGSSLRTFVLFPLAVLAVEFCRGFEFAPWFVPLLAWGFLQYYLVGLTLTFRSELALVFFAFSVVWFDARVRRDERRLRELFGAAYDDYARRVKRWIPFLL